MDNQKEFELYTLFRQENATWLSSHREHSQQFLTLIAAILGVVLNRSRSAIEHNAKFG